MRNSSSLDWLRFMHTPNDYRVSRIFFGYNCVHLKILLFLQLNYYNLSPLITKMLSKWIQVRLLARKLKPSAKINQ